MSWASCLGESASEPMSFKSLTFSLLNLFSTPPHLCNMEIRLSLDDAPSCQAITKAVTSLKLQMKHINQSGTQWRSSPSMHSKTCQ